jgi:hypothetical protein
VMGKRQEMEMETEMKMTLLGSTDGLNEVIQDRPRSSIPSPTRLPNWTSGSQPSTLRPDLHLVVLNPPTRTQSMPVNRNGARMCS